MIILWKTYAEGVKLPWEAQVYLYDGFPFFFCIRGPDPLNISAYE